MKIRHDVNLIIDAVNLERPALFIHNNTTNVFVQIILVFIWKAGFPKFVLNTIW